MYDLQRTQNNFSSSKTLAQAGKQQEIVISTGKGHNAWQRQQCPVGYGGRSVIFHPETVDKHI